MLEEARNNLLAGGNLPADPLQFATQWYNATSGPFSDFIGDVIEREEFLEPSSQFLQSYAGFYKVFKRNSEEYLKSLQLPVQSDISRVAGLVINLEDKVDRIEEALEDLGDATAAAAAIETPEAASAESVKTLDNKVDKVEEMLKGLGDANAAIETPEVASAESVRVLEGRLDSVEGKLDRVLAALENTAQNGGTPAAQANAESNGAATADATTDAEVEATDAARRKARELGVDLASVEGTGTDGKVTIEDVRKKGES
jgi:polyhydroxyalkanoic acid synthase PhaR subunit